MPIKLMSESDKNLAVETSVRVYFLPERKKWAVDFGQIKEALYFDRIVKDTSRVYWSTEIAKNNRLPRAWDATRGFLIVSSRHDDHGLTCVIQDRQGPGEAQEPIGFRAIAAPASEN